MLKVLIENFIRDCFDSLEVENDCFLIFLFSYVQSSPKKLKTHLFHLLRFCPMILYTVAMPMKHCTYKHQTPRICMQLASREEYPCTQDRARTFPCFVGGEAN